MLQPHKKVQYASKEDLKTHGLLEEAGVLVPHVKKMVAGEQTCSWCSDGFRPHMRELILGNCRSSGGDEAFFHAPAGNGEAMRFAYNSALSQGYSDYDNRDILGMIKTKEIAESIRIAATKGVCITQHRQVHHWPCAAGSLRKITYPQSIDLVIRGKHRIKHQIPGLQVAMDLFVDWSANHHTLNLIKKEPYLVLIGSDPYFTKQHEEWLQYAEAVKALPILR